MNKHAHTILSTLATLTASAMLAACPDGETLTEDPGPQSAPTTITGTVTTDVPVAGRTVSARCASGTLTATTGPDGSFQMEAATATLPCVLQVTTSDGTVLHSVAVGSGPVTAHITPATHLVVASMTGRAPDEFYDSFVPAAAATLTSPNLVAGASAVAATLADAGLPSIGNPVTTAHTAALGPLAQALADGGTTLAQLTATLAAASPVTPATLSGVPSLPAAQLLRRAAATCAALRSGTYRLIAPHYSDNESQTGIVTIEAPTLAVTDTEGVPQTWVANGPCRFIADAASATPTDVVVSPAGVIAARSVIDDGHYRVVLAFPEQTHAVAALAGNWNMLGLERVSGDSAATVRYRGVAASATVSAGGAFGNFSFCADIANCQPVNESIALSSNASGGFDLVNTTSQWTDRMFAYRTGGGELMLIGNSGNGSFNVWTRQRTTSLSSPGDKVKAWGLWSNTSNLSSSGIGEVAFTTVTQDAADGSWERQSDTDGHLETLVAGQPRAGYLHRAAATAPSNGGNVDVLEFTGLGLRGTGVTALWLPALGLTTEPGAFYFSVTKP